MKCAFLSTKIAASFEAAKRILLKVVKGSENVSYSGLPAIFRGRLSEDSTQPIHEEGQI